MSSIWTPDGEQPVGNPAGQGSATDTGEFHESTNAEALTPRGEGLGQGGGPAPHGQGAGAQGVGPTAQGEGGGPLGESAGPQMGGEPTPEQAEIDQLRRQLADAPAEIVVANHCFGLFELAALHLSEAPPKLGEAQLAIDALGALVENLTGRLGEAEPQLRDGLNQLRLAFVQIRAATSQDET